MRRITRGLLVSVLAYYAASASAEDAQVLTSKILVDNIDVRLVATKISDRRGQNLMAKFSPIRGEQPDFEITFAAHSHTTHETTLMNIMRCSARPKHGEWTDASLETIFSVPKDRSNDNASNYSHWYLQAIGVPDSK